MEIISTPHLISSLSTAKKRDRRAVKDDIHSYRGDDRGSWETSGEQYSKKLITNQVKVTGLILADQIYVQPIGVVLAFEETPTLNVPSVSGDDFKDVVVFDSLTAQVGGKHSVNHLEAGSVCLIQLTFKTWRHPHPVGYCPKMAAFHFMRSLNLTNRPLTVEQECDHPMNQDIVTIKFVSAYSDVFEITQIWNGAQELIDDIIDGERNLRPAQ